MKTLKSITRSIAFTGMAAGFMAAGLFATSAPVMAEEEAASDWSFSGNIALTNDYVYRGFTQTNEDFAVQGGFDLEHSSGFYAGVWASNLEFLDETNGNSSSIEIDLYGGYAGDFGNSIFSYDIGVIYYAYPGAPKGSHYEFWEFGLTLGADAGFAAFSAGFWFSPDFFGGIGDAIYIPLGVEVPIPLGNSDGWSLSFSGEIAYNKYLDLDPLDDDDYLNWNLGLTVSIDDWFDVDLRYHDTDLDDVDCRKICDERFVATVSRSF